jgi:hypothetical protein
MRTREVERLQSELEKKKTQVLAGQYASTRPLPELPAPLPNVPILNHIPALNHPAEHHDPTEKILEHFEAQQRQDLDNMTKLLQLQTAVHKRKLTTPVMPNQ